MRRAISLNLLFAVGWVGTLCAGSLDLAAPPHDYWTRPLTDRFSRFKTELETGQVTLTAANEKEFLVSLLRALEIPVSSQMLVFSTTSLQLRLISPSNPRALFFNEDVYIGYIPGGRIEVVSLDPQAGGIFYILDIPRRGEPVRIERSTRCMNCHAGEQTRDLPGLVVKSVVPGVSGGSLVSFRQEQTGHGIPFSERFGGWYVTGRHAITEHLGNLVGRLSPQGLTKLPIEVGKLFEFDRYPAATSDVLPQLVHEHQIGFVNRAIEAGYGARAAAADPEELARPLTRYLLFADEVPLPAGGVEGDAVFKADFLRDRRTAAGGGALKDFDLQTRLFAHRCSYMIYSTAFRGLPVEVKQQVYAGLHRALSSDAPDPEYAYLPPDEKQAIRNILRTTLTDLPADW
ncbi:MAG TPA: hypothetical protein VGO90_09300 [Chthoniobacteraceae bacterium]|nr:hypothetical protein [Chthoniobacter sp.]HEV7867865.1 hypothetical protein [Chthoniobacteraceae bacterium]